jgi:hypothetical protein
MAGFEVSTEVGGRLHTNTINDGGHGQVSASTIANACPSKSSTI